MITVPKSSNDLSCPSVTYKKLEIRQISDLRHPHSMKMPILTNPSTQLFKKTILQVAGETINLGGGKPHYVRNALSQVENHPGSGPNPKSRKWRLIKIVFKFVFHMLHPAIYRISNLESLSRDIESYKNMRRIMAKPDRNKSVNRIVIRDKWDSHHHWS